MMKNNKYSIDRLLLALALALACSLTLFAQDEQTTETTTDTRPVRNTFESIWLIDNQTVEVPIKGTFEMDVLHRFGTADKGYDDFWGIFAPSNIRMGFNFVPIEKLQVGFGVTKSNHTYDFNAKYAIFRQARSGGFPLSITYFVNAALDARKKENFLNGTDRFSYFHQLMIARKITDRFSLQVAPSLSHFNVVEGYVNQDLEIKGVMKNDHIAIAVCGRYKVGDAFALIANYDQPITEHLQNNPHPNISFGVELTSSSHAFQVFVGNFYSITPQRNNVFNRNDFGEGNILIGFNITRLWNF
jgi:hypothetical protein